MKKETYKTLNMKTKTFKLKGSHQEQCHQLLNYFKSFEKNK